METTMGYELKMYAVEKQLVGENDIALIGNDVYPINTANTGNRYYYSNNETKKYIKDTTPVIKGYSCSVIGMVDLCKSTLGRTGICDFIESDGSYIYAPTDGNKIVGLDYYGRYRSFVPIDIVIEDLLKDLTANRGQEYRRHIIAFDLLKDIQNTFKFSITGCLFFGH